MNTDCVKNPRLAQEYSILSSTEVAVYEINVLSHSWRTEWAENGASIC
jgi:hypothetical protein